MSACPSRVESYASLEARHRHCEARRASAPLVAHIIYRLDIGGLENGLINLINHMPAGRYRHAIICLTDASDFRLRLNDADVAVFALHKKPGKDLPSYVRLWRLLRRLKPAIVHTRNLGALDAAIPAALAGVRRRLHGEHGWDVLDSYGRSFKYNALRRCCRPFVSRYIAVSRDLETMLKTRIGVPQAKLTHIYNGVDSGKFHPVAERKALPRADFASPGCIVIGGVGRMHAVKDPLTLVQAFLRLRDRSPEDKQRLRLVMIGDGPLRAEAQALIERAGAAEAAWLPGSREDIAELLRCFDIFVLSSRNEGISNTVLEAMATGLPVVATRVGGNSELVTHGETGLLVPPADPEGLARALETYLEHPELMRRHGRAGRQRVETSFSLDAMVEQYAKVYDSVLNLESQTVHCG